MIGSTLQTCRVGIDPLVWEVLLIILVIAAVLGLVYLLRIHIAYRMAKNRHRDPLGWGAFVILFLAIAHLDNPAYCWRRHILSS